MLQKKIERLFIDYSEPVYQFLLKLSRSNDVAGDLIQEVFLAALKYYKPDIMNEKSWLFKIAYNLHANYYKKNRAVNTVNIENYHNTDFCVKYYDANWKILREEIIRELEKENIIFGRMLELRLDYNFTQDEIKDILQISSSTVARNFEKIQNILYKKFKKELNLDIID